jgi:hypothetical protein
VGNPEDHRTRACLVNEGRSKMEQPAATDDVAVGKSKEMYGEVDKWDGISRM